MRWKEERSMLLSSHTHHPVTILVTSCTSHYPHEQKFPASSRRSSRHRSTRDSTPTHIISSNFDRKASRFPWLLQSTLDRCTATHSLYLFLFAFVSIPFRSPALSLPQKTFTIPRSFSHRGCLQYLAILLYHLFNASAFVYITPCLPRPQIGRSVVLNILEFAVSDYSFSIFVAHLLGAVFFSFLPWTATPFGLCMKIPLLARVTPTRYPIS